MHRSATGLLLLLQQVQHLAHQLVGLLVDGEVGLTRLVRVPRAVLAEMKAGKVMAETQAVVS